MASLIFLILFCTELALMVYSLRTASRQVKTRSILALLVFSVFFLLVLAAVIPWSFRWYGLALLLFIRAAWAVRNLLRSPVNQPGRPRSLRMLASTAAAVLLTFLALIPALLFPPTVPLAPTGPYQVAVGRITLTDPQRVEQYAGTGELRHVNLAFWYPDNAAAGETFPLIVFSHGGLGTETSNESLYIELASHGYVVCSIGHPYHAFWTRADDGRLTFVNLDYLNELQREDAQNDKPRSLQYYQSWLGTRMADINLTLDALLAGSAGQADDPFRLIDPQRVGLIGHSLGGSAVLGIPRQREDIAAVVALESPYFYDILAVENERFIFTTQAFPVPVLNVYSDSSWDHLSEWPQYARNYEYLASPGETTFNTHLPGAGHFSLTDLSLASPFLVRLLEGAAPQRSPAEYLREVNKLTLDFFDRYLKDR